MPSGVRGKEGFVRIIFQLRSRVHAFQIKFA
jgi:hypothetical protein